MDLLFAMSLEHFIHLMAGADERSLPTTLFRLGSAAAIATLSVKLFQFGTSNIANELAEADVPVKLQDFIPQDVLGQLCRHESVALQKSAAQLLLDRTMRPNHIKHIIAFCGYSPDETLTLQATTALGFFANSKRNRDVLLKHGAIPALIHCLNRCSQLVSKPQVRSIQRAALIVLFDLTFHDKQAKLEASSINGVQQVAGLLEDSPGKDVQYWSLALLHSFVMEESLHSQLREHEEVGAALARIAVVSSGNSTMQKMAMQALVLMTTGDNHQSLAILRLAVLEGIVPSTIVALSADQPELVYWALGLLHELAMKKIAVEEIKTATFLMNHLYKVLSSTDAASQKIVLRILGFLAIQDDEFKRELLDFDFPERLGICIGSGDVEVAHWAIVIVHDLAMLGVDACKQIIDCGTCISAMVQSSKKDEALARLSAETFGLICASETLHAAAINDGVMDGIKLFASSEASDLQLWATLLLLNMVMTSPPIRAAIVDSDSVELLILLTATSTHDDIPKMSAKALAILSIHDSSVCEQVRFELLDPLLDRLYHSELQVGITMKLLSVLELLFRAPQHRYRAIQYNDNALVNRIIGYVEYFVELSPWSVHFMMDSSDDLVERGNLAIIACRLLCSWAGDRNSCAKLQQIESFARSATVLGSALEPLYALKTMMYNVKKQLESSSKADPQAIHAFESVLTESFIGAPQSTPAVHASVPDSKNTTPLDLTDLDLLQALSSTPQSNQMSVYEKPEAVTSPVDAPLVSSKIRDRVLVFTQDLEDDRDTPGDTSEKKNRSPPSSPSSSRKRSSAASLSENIESMVDTPKHAGEVKGVTTTMSHSKWKTNVPLSNTRGSTAPAQNIVPPTAFEIPPFSPRDGPRRDVQSKPESIEPQHPHMFTPKGTGMFSPTSTVSPTLASVDHSSGVSVPNSGFNSPSNTIRQPPRSHNRHYPARHASNDDTAVSRSREVRQGGANRYSRNSAALSSQQLRRSYSSAGSRNHVEQFNTMSNSASAALTANVTLLDKAFETLQRREGEEVTEAVQSISASDKSMTWPWHADGSSPGTGNSPIVERREVVSRLDFGDLPAGEASSSDDMDLKRQTLEKRHRKLAAESRTTKTHTGNDPFSSPQMEDQPEGRDINTRHFVSPDGKKCSNCHDQDQIENRVAEPKLVDLPKSQASSAFNHSNFESARETPEFSRNGEEGHANSGEKKRLTNLEPMFFDDSDDNESYESESDMIPIHSARILEQAVFDLGSPGQGDADTPPKRSRTAVQVGVPNIEPRYWLPMMQSKNAQDEATKSPSITYESPPNFKPDIFLSPEQGPAPLRAEFQEMLQNEWNEWTKGVYDLSYISTADRSFSTLGHFDNSYMSQSSSFDSPSNWNSSPSGTMFSSVTLRSRLLVLKVLRSIAEELTTMLTLGALTRIHDVKLQSELFSLCGPHMWAMMFAVTSPRIGFLTSTLMCIVSGRYFQDRVNSVHISLQMSTANMLIGPDLTSIRNEVWTFESAVGSASAASGCVSYFEVKILSDGIIQLGWTTKQANLLPEFGQGIGDSVCSFSYDGCRGCVWGGKTNDYARMKSADEWIWSIGDIVGCVLDLQLGEARFELNGVDSGIIVRDIDLDEEWFPAISLATGQQAETNFGVNGFWIKPPLEYLPLQPFPDGLVETMNYFVDDSVASLGFGINLNPESEIEAMDIACYYEITGLVASSWAGFHMPKSDITRRWCGIVTTNSIFKICAEDPGVTINQDTIIGCGIIREINDNSRLFFTVDGKPQKFGLRTTRNGAMMPWFNCQRPDVNFGQKEFLFNTADSPEGRASICQQCLMWANALVRSKLGST